MLNALFSVFSYTGKYRKSVKKEMIRIPGGGDADNPEWFPVPGMYGGFCFWIDSERSDRRIVVESRCRICDDSGQRHAIANGRCELVAQGFVPPR